MMTVMCKKHPNWPVDTCAWCTNNRSTVRINTESWVPGLYEHIDKQPIYIESKEHLFHECEKRGLLAKAFMKPKSQGQGYEHSK